MKQSCVAVATIFAAAAAHAETIGFDRDPPGSLPMAWEQGVIGKGAARWAVVQDESAPSQPNVLRQSGVGAFPWAVLRGKAMGVVEIRPKSGVYDFTSKYTKGLTEYFAPAPLEPALTAAVQAAAETAFAACACRDYARVDFMLSSKNEFYLLEINTLPGMKETSLLPMSARCAGLDFSALVRELVTPALGRFRAAGHLLNA